MTASDPPEGSAEPDHGLAERIAQFNRTRDIRFLWPDVSRDALARARREIERVTRAVLASSDDVSALATPLARPLASFGTTGADARAVGIAAFSLGVGPLLGRWVHDGRVDAEPQLRAVLEAQLDHNRRFGERVERGSLPVIDALLAAGVTPAIIKGFHTARGYWVDPAMRPAADIDIVVPAHAVEGVERILVDAGFVATTPRTNGPYKRHWSPAASAARVYSVERPDARNPWRIDLHDSFDRDFGEGANAALDTARDCTRPFAVAGRPLLATGQPLTLLVLACHVGHELNSMRLMRVVELVHVIRRDHASGTLDWDAVLTALRRADAARYAFPALALANDLAPATIDDRVMALCRGASNWAIRHTVARMVPAGSSPDREGVLPVFMWSRGAGDLVRRVARRIAAPGHDEPAVVRWRRLLARAIAGAIGIGAPDERPGTMPARRSPSGPPRA